jgi:hypothetical protein
MKLWFAVINPSGEILRAGCCEAEDAPLQGDLVLTFLEDPKMTGSTHRFDFASEAFVPLEEPA